MSIPKTLTVLVALSVTVALQDRMPPLRVKVSEGVSYSMADRKVLPDIADLKGHQVNAEVAVQIIISKAGDVKGARAFKGDSSLFKRSEEAALKWHYKPYLLNGEPIEVDTRLEFRFTRDRVEIVVPPRS